MIGKLMGGMFGGGKDEDEEDEDEDEGSIGSFLKKKSRDDDEDEDDEEGAGGFNLGDIVSQVMPSVMGMIGGAQQRGPPMQQQEARPRRKDTMRFEQGGGVRPTFMDVEVGNSQATPVKPFTAVGEQPPGNIYETIQSETVTTTETKTPNLIGTEGVTQIIEEAQAQVITDVNDPNVIKLPRYQDKLFGNENNMTSPEAGVVIPTPRQQPQPQVVNTYEDDMGPDDEGEDEDPYHIYTPEDFEGMPLDEKRKAFNEGVEALKSAESYVNSMSAAMKKDSLKKRKK
jgi:hypothetical protein